MLGAWSTVWRAAAAGALAAALTACGGSTAPAAGAPSTAPARAASAASSGSAQSGSAAPSVASGAAAARPVSTPPSAAPSASVGQVAVKGAYTAPSVVNAPLFVGVDEGIFKRSGIDAAIELTKNTAVPASLMGKELDFALGGGNEVVRSDLGGGSLVMVATASDYPIFSLFTAKQYGTVQSLAGEQIGITQPGSATDIAAHLFFDHFHLLDSVKLTPTGTVPAIFAAMGKGLVAGGILSPPTTAKAAQQGFIELINGFKLQVPLTHAGLLMTRAFITGHRETARRIVQGYAEAWAYCANPANKAQVVRAVAKYTKSAAPEAEAAYTEMLPVWQQKKTPVVDPGGIANVLKLTGDPKALQAKPAQFIDSSLLPSAR